MADAKRRLEERKGRRDQGVRDRAIPRSISNRWCSVVRFCVVAAGVSGRGSRAASSKRIAPGRRSRSRVIERIACSRRSARFEQNHRVELAAHEDYDQWRATARDTKGRVLKGNSKPFTPPELPDGVINLSDPDSRVMRTQGTPPRQAYNAQTAVNEQQIILAAEITIDAPDFGHLEPMLDTHPAAPRQARRERAARGGARRTPATGIPGRSKSIAERGIEVLVPPDGTMRDGIRPGWEHGFFDVMRQQAATDHGRQLYAKRKITVEPVYGQIKYNRRIDRFMRRGRAAAQSEWRLVTATHNLLKLHSHWIANTA